MEIFNVTNRPTVSNDTSIPLPYSCDSPTSILSLGYVSFLSVVIVINVISNMTVFAVIFSSKGLQRQTTNLFLASLSIADLLMGLFSFPVKLKQNLDNQLFCMSVNLCWFHFITDTLLSIASITHLFVIAIDRFISIKFTYWYQALVTKKKIRYCISIIWSYSILWVCLITRNWSNPSEPGVIYKAPVCYHNNNAYFLTLYVLVFLLPMLVMVFNYSYIYAVAVRHIKQVVIYEVSSTLLEKQHLRKQKEMKALRSVIYIFTAYIVCWTPSIVISISTMFKSGNLFWKYLLRDHSNVFLLIYLICIQILPPLSSTLNPFIYVLSNQQYRLALKTLVKSYKKNKEYSDNLQHTHSQGVEMNAPDTTAF